MACLPGSRKGASNMGDTSSVLQAKFFSMQMNLQGRGVHLRHSASFIFAVRGSSKVHELAKGMYVWSRQVPIASQLFHFNLPEPNSRKETMAAAAEGHGRTTTGRCEPSHPAKRRHLILLKSRGELLRCWKFGNDQITNFYRTDTLSVAKAFLSTCGCSWCFVWSTAKGNRSFFIRLLIYLHSIFQVGQSKRVGIPKLITWTQDFRAESSLWISVILWHFPDLKKTVHIQQSILHPFDSLPITLHLWAFQSMALPHAKHAVTAPRIRKTPFREASNFNWYEGWSVLCYMYLYIHCSVM